MAHLRDVARKRIESRLNKGRGRWLPLLRNLLLLVAIVLLIRLFGARALQQDAPAPHTVQTTEETP